VFRLGKWLITSAWPYINYVPHLGTIIGSVLSADIMARYLRLKGEEVLFVSGSDEHGTPIELEAMKRGISPKQLTDENHAKVKDLFERWDISFDNYTRTHNTLHIEYVQELLLKIYRNGYLFTKEIDFPYCPKCKMFLPDRFISGKCPRCGFEAARGDQCDQCGWSLEPLKLIEPACTTCGSTPIIKRTKHWYFDLPKFSKELEMYIRENDRLPDNARNFSLSMIKEGLEPRSVTRDNKWGIPAPFPHAEDKTIYVWIEAVLGYVSATIQHLEGKGERERWKKYWMDPSTRLVCFIGKDNIPFHVIIFPALLMASGERYILPWIVSSTEFLTFEGEKFSKSRHVGIWIDDALELYPSDYWRYTLLAIRPEVKDINFTWKTFVEKVNADLNDTLGNFIHRTLTFIYRYFGGEVPQPGRLKEADREILEAIENTLTNVEREMEQIRIQATIFAVMELAHSANRYFNEQQPWKAIKTNSEEAATTLYVSTQIVKALTIMLEPVIPHTAETLWNLLNLPRRSLKWEAITERLQAGHRIGKPKPLFSKVTLAEVEEKFRRKRLGSEELTIATDDFSRLDIRVGRIVDVQPLLGSKGILKLGVDVGEGSSKTAVVDLGEQYRAEELKEKSVVVLVNIKPYSILNVKSEVKVLAACDDENLILLKPESMPKVGSRVR